MVTVIAEAGVNHNGCKETALKLIDTAADCGADVVKFQTFDANELVCAGARAAKYQSDRTGELSQLALLKSLEIPRWWYPELIDRARNRGIEFLTTAFSVVDFEFIADISSKYIKIPSGELTNYFLLTHIAKNAGARTVLLSTGMSYLHEVKEAVDVLCATGLESSQIVVMHCTSAYPAPDASLNLSALNTLHQRLGVQVGYSDHSNSTDAGLVAVCLGAKFIEKHFTLSACSKGPDHEASLEPLDLARYVNGIRRVEIMLGQGVKAPETCEIENRQLVRKSLVALTKIKAGDVFSEWNVGAKRPGDGISPMKFPMVSGKIARRDFGPDDLIEL